MRPPMGASTEAYSTFSRACCTAALAAATSACAARWLDCTLSQARALIILDSASGRLRSSADWAWASAASALA